MWCKSYAWLHEIWYIEKFLCNILFKKNDRPNFEPFCLSINFSVLHFIQGKKQQRTDVCVLGKGRDGRELTEREAVEGGVQERGEEEMGSIEKHTVINHMNVNGIRSMLFSYRSMVK